MRWAIGALLVAATGALLLEGWLADRILQQDTVAGLISPQGADLVGIGLVVAFLALRLLVVLVFPAVFVGWACFGLSGVAVRRWSGRDRPS